MVWPREVLFEIGVLIAESKYGLYLREPSGGRMARGLIAEPWEDARDLGESY